MTKIEKINKMISTAAILKARIDINTTKFSLTGHIISCDEYGKEAAVLDDIDNKTYFYKNGKIIFGKDYPITSIFIRLNF